LAHGNRGRRPPNAFDEEIKQQVLELAQRKYVGFNTQHFTDCLEERERINISDLQFVTSSSVPVSKVLKEDALPNTVAAGNAIPRKGCCFRLAAVQTIGLRAEVLLLP